MTMQQLCRKCEALSKELSIAVRKMDGMELSIFRRRLVCKYDAGFENGWTVRMCRRVSDVFHAQQKQALTQGKKGLFGKKSVQYMTRLVLTSPQLPDCEITCTAWTSTPLELPEGGADVRVSGELEVRVFLGSGELQWRSGEFVKNPKVSRI